MSDKEAPLEGGIILDYEAPSSYDLPAEIQVEAQDPPEEIAPEEEGALEDPLAEEEEQEVGPSEEEMLDTIENSPGVQWRKYLRPILKIIKDTKLKVPVELHNSYTVGLDEDTFLGFHIVGVVHFLEDIPEDVAQQLQGSALHYDASITPDGSLGDVDLVYPTLEEPYKPTYYGDRNVDSL